MRASIQLEEVINLLPEDKVIKYVDDLEAIIKQLFSAVVSGVDDPSSEEVLKNINEKAEIKQRDLRTEAFEACREEFPELFDLNAFTASTRSASVYPAVGAALKDARRRNVETFMAFIGRSNHVIDDEFDAQITKVQQLINHFYNAGYGLAQAMFVQKTAFSELQDQAEILFEVCSMHNQNSWCFVFYFYVDF